MEPDRKDALAGVAQWPVETAAVGVTSPSETLAATGPLERRSRWRRSPSC